jgi:hypothetical protein
VKKILFAVLMAALFVIPAYAFDDILDTTMDLDLKIGVGLGSTLEEEEESFGKVKNDVNMPFAIAADFYYYNPDFQYIALGLGVSNLFSSKIDNKDSDVDTKIGFTNVYLAVKAKYDMKDYSSFVDNIYLLLNGGYGMVSMDPDDMTVDNGFYWAAGLGTEIKKHFILEVLYAVNYAKVRDGLDVDLMYSKIMLNVGYKFSF